MVKNIFIILLISLISAGCVPKIITKHEVIEKAYPVIYVPKVEKPVKPSLRIKTLTAEERKNIGKISKAYADDMRIVTGYVSILETIIDGYISLSESNPDVKDLPPAEKEKLNKIQKLFNKLKGNQ